MWSTVRYESCTLDSLDYFIEAVVYDTRLDKKRHVVVNAHMHRGDMCLRR